MAKQFTDLLDKRSPTSVLAHVDSGKCGCETPLCQKDLILQRLEYDA